MNKEYNMEFLKKFLMDDKDFKRVYESNESGMSYEESIDILIDDCFNSEFNPYLDKKYLDITWLCDDKNGIIYNLDDIYENYSNMMGA
jgi:hypothetical protein